MHQNIQINNNKMCYLRELYGKSSQFETSEPYERYMTKKTFVHVCTAIKYNAPV